MPPVNQVILLPRLREQEVILGLGLEHSEARWESFGDPHQGQHGDEGRAGAGSSGANLPSWPGEVPTNNQVAIFIRKLTLKDTFQLASFFSYGLCSSSGLYVGSANPQQTLV